LHNSTVHSIALSNIGFDSLVVTPSIRAFDNMETIDY